MGIIESKTKSEMMKFKKITLAIGVVSSASAVRLQSQDVFSDIGDWVSGAAEDVGDWAVGDIGDWTVGAANSIADFASDETDAIVGGVTGVFTAKGIENAWDWAKTGAVEATEAGVEQVIAIGAETPI